MHKGRGFDISKSVRKIKKIIRYLVCNVFICKILNSSL